MDCCEAPVAVARRADDVTIVLAGNPNVGKSVFFEAFTGVYVTVSNYPGTTLDVQSGRWANYRVVDATGVYGLSSANDEERIARDEVLAADLIVNVVDATHLARDLFLTQQIIDTGKPAVIALNLMDEARAQGRDIDIEALSDELGVPVVPCVAVEGIGIQELKARVGDARKGKSILSDDETFMALADDLGDRGAALLVAEGDGEIAARFGVVPGTNGDEFYRRRRARVDALVSHVMTVNGDKKRRFSAVLGELFLNPWTGFPLLLVILFGLYEFVGVFIAQTVVNFTEGYLATELFEPWFRGLLSGIIPPDSFVFSLVAGEFGVLTMTVTYIFGLLLPLVFGFYFFLAILEDSGLLPRIAVLADRTLTSFGLNGRAVIPMILGFGCVTMATVTTRMLGSEREKFIAVFLLGLTIPCSAQIGVIAALVAPLGPGYFVAYILIIVALYIAAGTFLNRIVPGESTTLFIDLPSIRAPRLSNVLRKSYRKTLGFLKEAGPIFVVGALAITVLNDTGLLGALERGLAPVTRNLLGLPGETARAFIMGIVRRDFGAAGLYDLGLEPMQILVSLVVITLFVPCIAAMLVMVKERNWKEALVIWVGSWITAFAAGAIVYQAARFLGLSA